MTYVNRKDSLKPFDKIYFHQVLINCTIRFMPQNIGNGIVIKLNTAKENTFRM